MNLFKYLSRNKAEISFNQYYLQIFYTNSSSEEENVTSELIIPPIFSRLKSLY